MTTKNYILRDLELMLWFVFLASFFLDCARVNGQADNTGFVSIDCGLHGSSSYKDASSTLTYSADTQYIDTGTNYNISVEYITPTLSPHYLNVRSFNTGSRNCYTMKSLVSGLKYLVRATFMYGNYDGLSKDSVIFDLHIGVNYWKTVNISDPGKIAIAEVIYVPPVDYIQVCLLNTGRGTPFISSLDLRPMKNSIYPSVNSTQYLALVYRVNAGPTDTTIIRYPDDPHDRMWQPWSNVPFWTEITTTSHIQNLNDDLFEVPSAVLQTAVTPVNSSELQFYWDADPFIDDPGYLGNLYFSELQNLTSNETREFNITLNNIMWYSESFSPEYLLSNAAYGFRPIHGYQRYNVTLTATANSTLPPILNAVELFIAMTITDIATDSGDANAINAIKSKYGIKRNWNGDPCAPKIYAWDGLNCSYAVSGSPRIIYLNLASSGLTGLITNAFANLKELQTLDLSHNNLTGSIPDVLSQLLSLTLLDLTGNQLNGSIPSGLLQKTQDGSLTLRVGDNAQLCSDGTSCDPSKEKGNSSKIVVAVSVPIVAVVILIAVGALIIYKRKRRQGILSRTSIVDTSIQIENRQFTYKDLEDITSNFQREIGRGGFGIVYSGFLVDGTPVAVKLRPHTSTQAAKEFMAEAQHLTRIHHKNLVSLIGYCKDEHNLALVLEYMSEGSLQDHLRERTEGTRHLSWRDRIRIALESAQGLEYLHKYCNPPLIHRDVKPNNILLNAKLEAKIADFGMSKEFNSNSNTHVSTNHVVGTQGYVDPEYHMTGQLTEKSDVYSFGVVILQIVTGQPAIIHVPAGSNDGSINIIQWVRQRLARGNIESVVDVRMQGEYDINSVWKAAEVALKCTAQSTAQRPTMTEVVMQLKECLELEAASTARNHTTNFYSANSSNGYSRGSYSTERSNISQNSTLEIEHSVGRNNPTASGPVAR